MRRLLGLSILFNLPFVLFRVHRLAFDTNVHIFLADHYRLRWWQLWEPRWYMGFSVASYPPLAHQLIALISRPASAIVAFFAPEPEVYPGAFRWVGEEIAFVVVLLTALALFPLAVRSFAAIFVGPRSAAAAALLAIFLPALSLTAWAFGQLPTLMATVALCFAPARAYAFLRMGRWIHLVQAIILAGVAGASHHGVFLLVPFVGAAVAWRAASDGWREIRNKTRLTPHTSPVTPHPSCLPDYVSRITPYAGRLVLWIALSAIVVAAVMWPFLDWSRGQSLQTPIDHPTRRNLIADPGASWFFFWPVYGPLLLVIPWAVRSGLRARRGGLWPLLALFLVLFVLGLGGTTGLPRLLYGAGWEWLVYDRFGFWAAMTLLPLAGAAVATWRHRSRAWARWAPVAFLAAMVTWSSSAGWWSVLSHSQPKALDLAPMVRFLNEPSQRPYRFLTLGFGDQFAKLSALTHNGTPDGNYHTARGLPELRTSGLGTLDGAVWNPQGAIAAMPFLARPEPYGVRWVFANHHFYHPILTATGWHFRWHMGEDGVTVWERPGVRPTTLTPPPADDGQQARWWGTVPLAALALAGVALAWESRWRAFFTRDRVIEIACQLRTAAWVSAALLMSLWWVHVVRRGDAPGVYYTYQSILIFASDVAVALTIGIWAVERGLRGLKGERPRPGPRPIALWGALLLAATALSALTSTDRGLSLAYAAHLLLLAGWYVVTANDRPSPATVGMLLGIVLVAEAGVSLIQVAAQSTGWPRGLYLPWPGQLTAAVSGASVVQNAEGVRWLRAYGTLPHPNILAGMTLVCLGGVVERFMTTGGRRWLGAAALGGMTLVLTFSRATWLGAGAMILAGFILSRASRRSQPQPAPAWRMVLVCAAAAAFTLAPVMPFFLARASLRAGSVPLPVEARSLDDRVLLNRASLDMIQAHPVTGVGAGAFVQTLARSPDRAAPREPAHNVFLLVAAESGLLGGFAFVGLWGAILWRVWRRRHSAMMSEVVWGLVLIGFLTVGMFDHFWWTLGPARMAWVTVLGLWVAAPGHRTGPASAGPAQ